MSNIDQSIAAIRAFVAEANIRPSRLAAWASLHPNTLRKLHQPDWNPTSSTLAAVEAAIDRHRETSARIVPVTVANDKRNSRLERAAS